MFTFCTKINLLPLSRNSISGENVYAFKNYQCTLLTLYIKKIYFSFNFDNLYCTSQPMNLPLCIQG